MDNRNIYHPLQMINKLRQRAKGAEIVKIHTERHIFTVLKGILALLFVFLQLFIIIGLSVYFSFSGVAAWYLLACFVVSIITAVYVLSSNRSSGTKAIWVIFILVIFVAGFIVFWLSDDKVMYGRQRKRHLKILKNTQHLLPRGDYPDISGPVRADCRYLYNAGGFYPYRDSAVEYYRSGGILFDNLLKSLEEAEKFIFVEFFIIADGTLFERFWDIIQKKLDEGVEVYIIYDDMGCSKELKMRTAHRMRKSKAHVKAFNRLVSRFSFAMNYRDHRKIVVVDGKVAYTGGCNLSDEYTNEKRMYGYWKDSAVKTTGVAVDAISLMFMRQWAFIVKKDMDYEKYLGHYEKLHSDYTVIPYGGGPDFKLTICKGIYENMIAEAHEFIYIFTPYFVPEESVVEALKNKALSGVDVRLCLPDIPDKSYVFMLTLDTAEKLIPYGVKVYRLTDSFVHSKVVLTENAVTVSSANFDMRSFYQQFENAIYTNDPKFINDVFSDFDFVIKESKQVEKAEKHGLIYRIVRGILRIVMPLM